MSSSSTPSRLTLFALLFAWANIIHQLSYPEWIKGVHIIGWLLFLFSSALAIRPSLFPLFLATLILRVAYTLNWMPMIRGHLFIEGLFTLGILIAFALKFRALEKFHGFDITQQNSLFERIAPFLRVTSIIVYLAVTISKLNTEFILPEKSAAVQLLLWTSEKHSFVPNGPWAQQVSIWGTLLFEGGIPILLLFPRTRWLGLFVGLLFHSLLGFLPLRICSFTLTMCLLLFAWFPTESPRLIHSIYLRVSKAFNLPPFSFALLFYAVAGATGLLYAARNGISTDMRTLDLGIGIWWWLTIAMLVALWGIRDIPGEALGKMIHIRSWPLTIYAGFVFFNCLCPYIGLKTRSALSMHCNLRTEKGYWNHLFLPESMRVFNFQNSLITILDSSLPDLIHLKEKVMPLPYFEFKRWCRLAKNDFHVTYHDPSGKVRHFEKKSGKASDPVLVEPSPLLEWFLCFNPVGASHDYMPSLVQKVGPSRNIVPHFDSSEGQ
ncbi:MAG: hypothetical protein ACI92G_001506 [Candidatus Pelagisphaera sp.]|jgi:hypothetical protein